MPKEIEKEITLKNHQGKKVYLRKNSDKYLLKVAEKFVKQHFPEASKKDVDLILGEGGTAGMTDENNVPVKEINIGVQVSDSAGGANGNLPIILVPEISKKCCDFCLWVYGLDYYSNNKTPACKNSTVCVLPSFVDQYLKGTSRLVYM